ncbi:Hypothetical predicted protein [Cloeon dipterum]|uniref:Uncharacterized protein n=1 Tax=Cloeon dipterum TaxID=197152 RepID=A0A8S1E8P8_9INSE|nr:Hypothetical predicted protein [Cloeon dipterum]
MNGDKNGPGESSAMSLEIRPSVSPGLSPDTIFANLVKKLFETTKTRFVSYADQKAALLEAISPDLTTVNFAEVIDLFPENHPFVIDVLVTIASRAVNNMKDFQIMEGLTQIPIIYWYSMNEDMVDGIAMMKNLTILRVERFSVSFSSLMHLCGQLPSLKYLYFRIDSQADFSIEDIPTFQKNFGNLEIFEFYPTSSSFDLNNNFQKNLTSECIRWLHNLHLLGDPECFVDMMEACMTNECLFENGESKLTYMTLLVRKDVHQALSTFPNVKHLHTRWESLSLEKFDVSGLLEFPKLSKLTMTCLRYPLFAHHIDEFLTAYKKNLTHLILDLNATIINLKDVFNMIFPRCHNLQNLNMRDFQIVLEPKWSMPSCDSLRELELEFSMECNRDWYVYISNILSMPNLDRVMMFRVPTTLEELTCTSSLLIYLTTMDIEIDELSESVGSQETSPDKIFANRVKELFEKSKTSIIHTDVIWNALQEVTSRGVTKINFAEVLDLYPEFNWPGELLLMITSRTECSITDFQIMEGFLPRTNLYLTNKSLEDGIARLKNLRILKVQRFSISFSSLMDLCQKLPSLKNLYFRIIPQTDKLLHKSKAYHNVFRKLEVFQFSPDPNNFALADEFRKLLTNQCIYWLPNLQLVGDPEHFVDMLPTCVIMASDVNTNQKNKLTHMEVQVIKNVTDVLIRIFPDVTHLHVKWGGSNPLIKFNVDGLLQFPHLTKLTMTFLNETFYPHIFSYLPSFLAAYKTRLTHLILDNTSSTMINLADLFSWIFHSCHMLNQLVLLNFNNQWSMNWSGSTCDSLRELKLEFAIESKRDAYIGLSKILSVPNLEKVSLIRFPTTFEELKITTNLVKEQKILRLVNRFELDLFENESIKLENHETTLECLKIIGYLRAYRTQAHIQVKIFSLLL